MKHQYQWILNLLPEIPQLKIRFSSRDECDDEFVKFEGGDSDEDPEYQYHGGHGEHSHGHSQPKGPASSQIGGSQKDIELYKASMKKLKCVAFVSVFFIIAQCIGGYMANSIAIFTDTAHLASDMVGFMMSMVAMKMSMRPASKELTFGWHRAEIIGTMVSVIFLLTLTIWLVFEATGRVVDPQEVFGVEMAITAVMGLFFNLVQMRILHQGEGGYHMGGGKCSHDHGDGDHGHSHEGGDGHGHGEEKKKEEGHGHGHSHDHGPKKETRRNINVDAAFLHALGDMIMSIGVCCAATVIYFKPDWVIADPICTFVFSVIVCFTVTPIVKNCVNVLMEGAPSEIDIDQLIQDIQNLGEDVGLHAFHVWSISVGKFALSSHVTTKQPSQHILREVNKICQGYGIDHLAIQIEDTSDPNNVVTCEQSLNQQYEIPPSPKKSHDH